MIIVNDLGPVGHAWLDGEAIDPSCRSVRCRLVIGEFGGVVCDMVVSARELADEARRSIATYAVLFTDPRDPSPIPLDDGAGRTARIVADEDVPGDRVAFDRLTSTIPDEALFIDPKPLTPTMSRTRSLTTAFAIAAGFAIFLCGMAVCMFPRIVRPDLRPDPAILAAVALAMCGGGGLLVGVAYGNRRSRGVAKAARDHEASFRQTMDRELERRARLPETTEAPR